MRNIVGWGVTLIIILVIISTIYMWPTSSKINANIGLVEVESGNYYQRIVSIPLHGDIDIKINDKYWIYIDTR